MSCHYCQNGIILHTKQFDGYEATADCPYCEGVDGDSLCWPRCSECGKKHDNTHSSVMARKLMEKDDLCDTCARGHIGDKFHMLRDEGLI